MLKRIDLAAVTFVIIALCGSVAQGTITGVVCLDNFREPLPAEAWSFDYDLQAVTLTVSIYDAGRDLSGPAPPHFFWVEGTQDAPSILTVIENFVNETGVSLVGYNLSLGAWTDSEIIVGTVQATGSPEVRQEHTYHIDLAWSEPIPHGASFTVQFDVLNYPYSGGYFGFALDQAVVPEPLTLTLLGLGGLALVRTRRSIRSQRTKRN